MQAAPPAHTRSLLNLLEAQPVPLPAPAPAPAPQAMPTGNLLLPASTVRCGRTWTARCYTGTNRYGSTVQCTGSASTVTGTMCDTGSCVNGSCTDKGGGDECRSHSDCDSPEYCSACGSYETWNKCTGTGTCKVCTWTDTYCSTSDGNAKQRCGSGRKYKTIDNCSSGETCSKGACVSRVKNCTRHSDCTGASYCTACTAAGSCTGTGRCKWCYWDKNSFRCNAGGTKVNQICKTGVSLATQFRRFRTHKSCSFGCLAAKCHGCSGDSCGEGRFCFGAVVLGQGVRACYNNCPDCADDEICWPSRYQGTSSCRKISE